MSKQLRFVPKEKQNLNKIISLQRDNDIIAMLLNGETTEDISKYICQKYRINKGSAKTYISECRQEIKKRKWFEVNNLVSLHIHRYEQHYKELIEIGAEGYAINALRAKEKLLGFHKEGFHMKVTQGEVQSIHQRTIDSEYDFGKLDKKETLRLEALLEKASRNGKGNKLIQRTN